MAAESRAELSEPLRRIVEGTAAEKRGDWKAVIAALDSLGRETDGRGFPLRPIHRHIARVKLAAAWERIGRADSAAAWYELLADPPSAHSPDLGSLAYYHSSARLALVRLYAQIGRLDDARRHWEGLERDVRDPEPGFAARMNEAGLALRNAQAMRAPTR